MALHGRLARMRAFFRLLSDLTARNLKVKYQRSFLGFLWTLLNPLATISVLIFVFGSVVRLDVPDYWVFLLSGFFVWNFTQTCVTSATTVLAGNAAVIRSAKVATQAFILASVAAKLVEYLLELAIVLALVIAFHHHGVPVSFALLPVLIVLQLLLVLGIVLPVATIAAFYDDVQHSVPILFLMLFYVSPVFYPASMVTGRFAGLYALNPFAMLLTLFQRVIYDGQIPTSQALGDMLIVGGVLCVAGALVFRRFRAVLPEVL
jgi:ABC-type polysaccharide/polyol phosphate export permease